MQECIERHLFLGMHHGGDFAHLMIAYAEALKGGQVAMFHNFYDLEVYDFINGCGRGYSLVLWGGKSAVCIAKAAVMALQEVKDSQVIIDPARIRIDDNDIGNLCNHSQRVEEFTRGVIRDASNSKMVKWKNANRLIIQQG